MNAFNGLRVKRTDQTIFIPLPKSAWVETDCACQYCSDTPSVSKPAFWDTLAIAITPRNDRADTTWTVHYPELHGAKPKRSTP